MPTLIAPDEFQAAAPPRELPQLRLSRAGQVERVVDVTDGKWSIGSSARCQVRLPAGEAQPLQCLLSLADSSAEVTRWAAGVLWNGREFARQTLAAGDRLTIGHWELEWQPATAKRGQPVDRKSRPASPVSEEPPAQPSPPLPVTPDRATVDWVPSDAPESETESQGTTEPPPCGPAVLPELPAVGETEETTISLATPMASIAPAIAEDAAATCVVEPPVPATRPAAKTVLVASRLTDPFDGLLGPAPRPAPEPAVTQPIDASSSAFQDRLVLELWRGRFSARERARQLIASSRAARVQIVELQAAIATIENQLAQETEQAAGEAADRKAQLERLEQDLAAATADRQQIAAELESLRNARPRTAPPDPRLQTLADELSRAQRDVEELRAQIAVQEQESASLRTQLETAEELHRVEAERFEAAASSNETRDAEFAAERTAWEQQCSEALEDAERLRGQLGVCETQVEELRGQTADQERELASIRTELEAAEVRHREEVEQFAASQSASANRDEQFASERTTWDQQRKSAEDEADRLRDQLYACEMQIEELREQVTEAGSGQEAIARQLENAKDQQTQWLAEWQSLQAQQSAALAEVTSERDGLLEQLEQLAARFSQQGSLQTPSAAEPPQADPWSRSAVEIGEEVSRAEFEAATEPAWTSWASDPSDTSDRPESSRATIVEAVPRRVAAQAEQFASEEPAEASDVESATSPKETAPETETALVDSLPAREPAAVEPPDAPEEADPPYEATSFIDKYRHLLEEGGDAEPSPRLSRPALDDEYQSTRGNQSQVRPEEDADEALEAYMSNLMRRVRGDGSSAAIAAATAAARYLETAPEVKEPTTQELSEPIRSEEPATELDANGLLRLARKPQASTDLSALRELANTSARTAIARHRQRRRAELALSKGIICVLASCASAFLIITAPSMSSPWFWGGCVTLAAAAVAGVQLALIAGQRLHEGRARRRAAQFLQDGRGSATAPSLPKDAATSLEST